MPAPNPIFAMDTHFMARPTETSLDEACALVRATGYDSYSATFFEPSAKGTRDFGAACARHGLTFSAAYVLLDAAYPPEGERLDKVLSVLRALDAPTDLELAVQYQDFGKEVRSTAHDEAIRGWLQALLPEAEARGIRLCLYPHFGFVLERCSDCLRVAEALDHPLVKVVFCGYHWHRVDAETALPELFMRAGERLRRVNLSGAQAFPEDQAEGKALNPEIQPLDAGELDNAAVLKALRAVAFPGPIGVQGFGVSAEPEQALTRSRAFLQQHWGA